MPPSGDSQPRRALVISPEAPYPMHGGGPLRTVSLIEYLRQRYTVDLIVFRDDRDIPVPPGHFGDVLEIQLSHHSRALPARIARNAWRYLRQVPPLVDRFSGLESEMTRWLTGRRYEVALIEHFWAAPYVDVLKQYANKVVCDLHNIESRFLEQVAPIFAPCATRLERKLLPRFDHLLVTSPEDAQRISAKSSVYPNAVPMRHPPPRQENFAIAMSGNFDFPPNQAGVRWFATRVWPTLKNRHPTLEWRLIGKNPSGVRQWTQGDPQIRATGPVEDAIAELAQCRAAVVPLQSGSGTRLKILEAWAAGTPVVSTSIGCEGLGARHGEELLIADTPETYIASVLRVLEGGDTAIKLRAACRSLLEREFVWPRAWEKLDRTRALY